jgi:hypothetical protein
MGSAGRRGALIPNVTIVLIILIFSLSSHVESITFPCISPLLGPTIPSAPSREPSPARSRTPDDDPFELRLTIRGGDLQVGLCQSLFDLGYLRKRRPVEPSISRWPQSSLSP